MSNKKDLGAANEHQFKKDLTALEVHDLSLQLQNFIREKDMVTYVKFKVSALLESLIPVSKRLSEATNELIEKHGNGDGTIDQFINDGEPGPNGVQKKKSNPKYKLFRDEVKPLEEDRNPIEFNKLPLSMIMRMRGGGYPAVYKLFYEDPAAAAWYKKQLEDPAE